jgi:hypothetical protein
MTQVCHGGGAGVVGCDGYAAGSRPPVLTRGPLDGGRASGRSSYDDEM